jgi:hypothetical protein
MPWFDSRRYQIFWEVVGLERGPLSLVSTTEELLERKSNGSGLESREYRRRDPHGALCPQKLALTSWRSGGHSVGIVRSRTKATELLFRYWFWVTYNTFGERMERLLRCTRSIVALLQRHSHSISMFRCFNGSHPKRIRQMKHPWLV